MPGILAISSQVACGHVGLSAIVPAVQALQQQIIALPTILLSNHPGHPHVSGSRIEPAQLQAMLNAIEANGWLQETEIILTGYCPTVEHVMFARDAILTTKQQARDVIVLCDPIIGDEAVGVYIDEAAAQAIKHELVPLADILIPNHFELGWLTGQSLSSVSDAVAAARALDAPETVVTSVPWQPGQLANLHVAAGQAHAAVVQVRSGVPKGTGDFLSGVFACNQDIGLATAQTATLIETSLNRDHLNIAGAAPRWLEAAASPTITV